MNTQCEMPGEFSMEKQSDWGESTRMSGQVAGGCLWLGENFGYFSMWKGKPLVDDLLILSNNHSSFYIYQTQDGSRDEIWSQYECYTITW